jgi:hypothetical protein
MTSTEQTETFCLPNTEAGTRLLEHLTETLHAHGFTTTLHLETGKFFELQVLTATPAPRPNREARGCNLR